MIPGVSSACSRRLFAAAALSFLFCPAAMARPRKHAHSRLHANEQLIAKIPNREDFKVLEGAGGHVAWAEQNISNNKWTVYEDSNQIGGSYDSVEDLEFSKSVSRLAFFGLKGTVRHPVINGQERPSVYTDVSPIAFQPHGLGWAFRACYVQNSCTMIVNGGLASMPRETYDDVSPPQYSPDGKHLGFLVQFHGKWIALVDGKAVGPPMDGYSCLGFSPHGSHFFVCGTQKKTGYVRWAYFLDGNPGSKFAQLGPINFSSDGLHYAYGASGLQVAFKKDRTSGTVVLYGKSGPRFQGSGLPGAWMTILNAPMIAGEVYSGSILLRVGPCEPVESSSIACGGASIFPIILTPGHFLAGTHTLSAGLNGVSDPVFDRHDDVVYAARRGKNDVVVFDGSNAGPRFDDVLTDVTFSNDGSHSAYVAFRGRQFFEVLDNQARESVTIDDLTHHKGGYFDPDGNPVKPPPPDLNEFSIGWTSLSSHATHFAYEIVKGGLRFKQQRTRRAQRVAVLDGKLQKRYNAFGISLLQFTPNEQHFWYTVVGAAGKKSLVVVDGRETTLYDELTEPQLDPGDKGLSFFAKQKKRILRVTIPFSEN